MTQGRLHVYARFLERLTPERLDDLHLYCAEDMVFIDPFNHVTGLAAYRRVLEKMYEDVPQISFAVETAAEAEAGALGFLRWRICGMTSSGREMDFEGVTELHFDSSGKISLHRDFWDPAGDLYSRIPILGWVLRRIGKRLSIGEG